MKIWHVGRRVAPQIACEHARLDVGQETDRHLLAQYWMDQALLLAFLVRGDRELATLVVQEDGAAWTPIEMLGLDLRNSSKISSASAMRPGRKA